MNAHGWQASLGSAAPPAAAAAAPPPPRHHRAKPPPPPHVDQAQSEELKKLQQENADLKQQQLQQQQLQLQQQQQQQLKEQQTDETKQSLVRVEARVVELQQSLVQVSASSAPAADTPASTGMLTPLPPVHRHTAVNEFWLGETSAASHIDVDRWRKSTRRCCSNVKTKPPTMALWNR